MRWYDDTEPGMKIPSGFVPDLPMARPELPVIAYTRSSLLATRMGQPLWVTLSVRGGPPMYLRYNF